MIVVNRKAIGVVPFVMLRVQSLQICSKTLVEPDVSPVAPLDIIAEPVLAQLVGNEVRAGIILVGAFVVQRTIGQCGRTDVLLASEEEVLHCGLSVLLIRIINACGARKESNHVGSQVNRPACRGYIDRIWYVVITRLVFIFVGKLAPGTHSKGDEIRAVGNAFRPVVSYLTRGTRDLHQLAVRNDDLSFGDCRDRLACGHVVRVIPTRKPKVIELSFALRKDLVRPVRIIRRWIYEK